MVQEFDPELIIPNPDLTLAEGAVQPWVRASQSASGYYAAILEALSSRYGFSTKVPVRELPETARKLILYGNGGELIKVGFENSNGRKRVHEMHFEGLRRQQDV